MQQEKGFTKYLVIVVVLLGAVFLSQQSYSREFGKDLFSKASAAVYGYWAKGANWASDAVYSKINKEVQNRGEIIKNEITSEKENISNNVVKKVGDYFSGIADSVVNPGNNACPTTPESSQ